jgi:PEP-CTERM motif
MVRTFALTLTLALSLLAARPAFAVPVSPVDLATLDTSSPVGSPLIDDFTAFIGSGTVGENATRVFFDGVNYIYTQTVTPENSLNLVYNTEFAVSGFTGVAGWSFADTTSVGAGGAGAFQLESVDDRLIWIATLGGAFGQWNALEPITFFFVSTQAPSIKNYSLFSLMPVEMGTAQGLAPVPEPGSIALFGSGLVALYTAVRRRRSLKM